MVQLSLASLAKEEMWFIFRQSRKINHFLPFCASEAINETKAKITALRPAISALAFSARFARKKRGECGSFFGLCPKNEPPLLLFASEASNEIPKAEIAALRHAVVLSR